MKALFLALTALTLATSVTAQVFVNPTGSDVTGTGSAANPFKTISHAANVATAGETLRLSGGTFGDDEQIVLGTKDLSLQGAGRGITVIKPHPTLVLSLPTGFGTGTPTDHNVGITIDGPVRIDMRDLTIDCDFRIPNTGRIAGVLFRDGADGTLDGVEILHARADPLNSQQGAAGVVVRGDDPTDPCDVTLHNCQVHGWGKAGITAFFNAGLTVQYCTVQGAGPTSSVAQNCVQIGYDATGNISHNVIGDASFLRGTLASTGILLFDAADVAVDANRVARCDDNIAVIQQTAASKRIRISHNVSTAALMRAVRVEGNTAVKVLANVIHHVNLLPASSPAYDSTSVNQWSHNNFSDWSGVGPYNVPGGTIVDPDPRRGCNEFATGSAFAVGGVPQDVVTANLNNSGLTDFATVNGGATPSLSIAIAAATNGSYSRTDIPFGNANGRPVALVAGEFNGAAGVDLVAITASISPATTEDRFFVFANNGFGSFTLAHSEQLPPGATGPNDIAAGDVNGDSLDDFAIAYVGGGNGGGAVFTNLGGGTAWAATALVGPTLSCKGIAMGAIDAGTSVDIALSEGNLFTGRVRVYANSGAGSFTEIVGSPFTVDPDPTACALIDSDGDGDLEVLAACTGPLGATHGSVAILNNQLPGAMPVQLVPTDLGPVALATGNVAGDTDPDTVRPDAMVINLVARDITLLGEFGVGGPAQGALCLAGFPGAAPVAASIDQMNDGALEDLVIADSSAARVIILPGVATPREDIYGAGCPGSGGRVPLISPAGKPPVVVSPNPGFAVHVKNARPVSGAVLLVSVTPSTGLGPCSSLVGRPVTVIPTTTTRLGTRQLSLAIPPMARADWFRLYLQWGILDPGGSPDIFALSAGLNLRVKY